MNISVPHKKVFLQEMAEREVPNFYYNLDKKYFYYLDGKLYFKKEPNTFRHYDLDNMYTNEFKVGEYKLYDCVLKWIEREIESGNSVSLVRQIQNANREECRQYNEVFSKQTIYIEDIKSNTGEINLAFNVEYQFAKKGNENTINSCVPTVNEKKRDTRLHY
jgi:hypothetical protein